MSEDEQQDDVPASAPLASLREKVKAAREQATIDLEIADLDVVVRYRALGFETFKQLDKRRGKDEAVAVNASVLADACVGVFACTDDDRLVSIDPEDPGCYVDDDDKIVGQPLKFSSPRLGELLGVEQPSAQSVIVAIFPRELQIALHSDKLLAFSRGEEEGIGRAALGN